MIAQRHGAIGVPDHASQFLHISREAIGPSAMLSRSILAPPFQMNLAKCLILHYDQMPFLTQ